MKVAPDVMARMHLMRIMFGGQINQFDVHKVGFDFDILCLYLAEVGFEGCTRVAEFNLFNDCSNCGMLSSLLEIWNLLMNKCGKFIRSLVQPKIRFIRVVTDGKSH
ncbi:hypothetical protein [Pseudanabaena sp. BC1403]|uniref:hypothetical protein n=1 Tax=Pseudanabaena sp. BC1403 TaxID=2043171 RepID=UPI0015E1904F|nr:hypothetical protein [Pseudanabaena sp. BC1403]